MCRIACSFQHRFVLLRSKSYALEKNLSLIFIFSRGIVVFTRLANLKRTMEVSRKENGNEAHKDFV